MQMALHFTEKFTSNLHKKCFENILIQFIITCVVNVVVFYELFLQ